MFDLGTKKVSTFSMDFFATSLVFFSNPFWTFLIPSEKDVVREIPFHHGNFLPRGCFLARSHFSFRAA